ncbi:hypothetical protein N7509_006571 [Penicillium cosmopolitanum]|uniref:Uncharacterized protein n=1 Tax=Penicillium cosmopolitanum TaxID=1131564 RepID=A0A9W9VXF4_9EURO|nr:uncharacterized protein N7509_006571 [Penicillium cosmopolitanum]KAJ5391081.1 hypothetical protein N7509_006571 [Penicillium cosmopolitanum]
MEGTKSIIQNMEQSSSSSMSMSSMTMPMKRSTPTADATPTSSASMQFAKSTDKPMNAQNSMIMMM